MDEYDFTIDTDETATEETRDKYAGKRVLLLNQPRLTGFNVRGWSYDAPQGCFLVACEEG